MPALFESGLTTSITSTPPGARAESILPFEFVDPLAADVAAGDQVRVTCRVW